MQSVHKIYGGSRWPRPRVHCFLDLKIVFAKVTWLRRRVEDRRHSSTYLIKVTDKAWSAIPPSNSYFLDFLCEHSLYCQSGILLPTCRSGISEKDMMSVSIYSNHQNKEEKLATVTMGSSWLPEQSFQSWGNYRRALASIPSRLIDRMSARTQLNEEVTDIKARSNVDMNKNLTWWDLIWFGIGAVIGAGIFVLTGVEAKNHAGPAIVISYVIAGSSAMLSAFCYTEFADEIPLAGGAFAYLRVELGDFIAFIGAGNIVLGNVIGSAAVARGWTSYFASLIFSGVDVGDKLRIETNLAEGYNQLDPIAVAVLVLVGLVAIWSTKGASYVNWIASLVNMFIIAFIIVAGLALSNSHNLTDDFFHYGARGIFSASSVLFFAYLGFDAISTMAEEVKNPGRDIPIGLLGSMTICTFIYIMMAVTLSLMVPFLNIDEGAPFSVAFSSVGWDWAKYIVALGALKGITTVLLVSTVGQARYLIHIARSHLIPPWFSQVNKQTRTPINATAITILASSVVGFFTDLPILGNLLSLSSLFIFFLVAVALLVRRYYVPGQTSRQHGGLFIVYMLLIILSSTAIAAFWGLNKSGYALYAVCGSIWSFSTLLLHLTLRPLRQPETWGVPFMPWIPSLSVAFNIFLLGSLDKASFIRFGYWTGMMLVYYFFFGLHSTYDAAKYNSSDLVPKTLRNEGQTATIYEQDTPSSTST
uniref:Cationic amino acid transporter C-terminal domain-containing protein n=3 Tax=Physcomitrium patens TaxID=3218 RepID=A0A2K1IUF6_PHYPA|nr:hypothetical protein PHYPA_024849 [Physcomitrium patens]